MGNIKSKEKTTIYNKPNQNGSDKEKNDKKCFKTKKSTQNVE